MKLIIGADEAGRGCIAGSIFACAAIILDKDNLNTAFCDSKKMSKTQRDKQMKNIIDLKANNIIDFVIVKKTSNEIDSFGLGKANKDIFIESIDQLIEKVLIKFPNIELNIIIDGNLKIASKKYDKYIFNSIIKADDTFQEVSLASVIAKSAKDLEMYNLSLEYTNYGFENHSGYDTKEHRENIYKYGYLENIHRKSTKTIINYIQSLKNNNNN